MRWCNGKQQAATVSQNDKIPKKNCLFLYAKLYDFILRAPHDTSTIMWLARNFFSSLFMGQFLKWKQLLFFVCDHNFIPSSLHVSVGLEAKKKFYFHPSHSYVVFIHANSREWCIPILEAFFLSINPVFVFYIFVLIIPIEFACKHFLKNRHDLIKTHFFARLWSLLI